MTGRRPVIGTKASASLPGLVQAGGVDIGDEDGARRAVSDRQAGQRSADERRFKVIEVVSHREKVSPIIDVTRPGGGSGCAAGGGRPSAPTLRAVVDHHDLSLARLQPASR
jgi:hypothetical protein